MTKMDMVWVVVASLIEPDTSSTKTVARGEIEESVARLFETSLTAVMVERHLVSSVDRMADKDQPNRGGSRNRYLFRTADGALPSLEGRFRLYKQADAKHDGWEKTGPTHPDALAISSEYKYLIDWYTSKYASSI